MSEAEASEARRLVIGLLESRIDIVVARIVARVQSFDDPVGDGYWSVPAEELALAAEVLSRAAMRALSDGRPPNDDELAQAVLLGERRAAQGVPLEVVLRGFSVGAREALDTLKDLATSAELDAPTTMELIVSLWDWVDGVSVAMTEAHRRVELSQARREQQARISSVQALVAGTLSAAAIEERAAAVGLDSRGEYLVLRAKPSPEHPAEEIERLLLGSPWTVGLSAVLGDDVVAILREPPANDLPVTAGLGAAVPLTGLSRSFDEAGRALATALAFDRSGSRRLTDDVLRAAILAEDELGELLLRRYVTPVRDLGSFGEELLNSVHTFIAHDQNIDESARALFVHPNTLRHRLARFEETTGASLRNVEQLAEVWWALTRHAQTPRAPASGHQPVVDVT